HGSDSVMLAQTVATLLRTDSVTRSAIYASGDEMHLWTVAPVKADGRTIGVIAEQRRLIGNAQTEQLIERLTGSTASVYITSRGRADWTTALGRPVRAPIDTSRAELMADTASMFQHEGREGRSYFAVAPVPNTPWRIVLAQSETSILARPRETLQRLLSIGIVLLGMGAVFSWWLSRLETRPLGALREAADAVAAGDYSQVVRPEGAEETAALADAFNTMALRISGVHTTLAHQNEALRRANEAKARFLAVMSHELRTPLNAIGGHAELVAMGVHGPVTTAQVEALERIGRSKDQLVTLVSDILHYARLEATPMTVARQDVRVQRAFDSVRETVIDQFDRRGVTLTVGATDALVCADAVRVQQVLINLVTNALQFTESGGTVSMLAEPRGGFTALRVRDTGVGIPVDQQAAIFEPFVQADNSLTRRAGGAGLGLAIVLQLVTAMGGEVDLESEVGVGSTFTVLLPNAVAADTAGTVAGREPSDAAPAVAT
ncbi:MAG TPA: HAMP domain-containing sensor histidine kinase, partial [Gemmatimonadaceae bacterium]|nr:HAMP domain-containing sensor histidine kinase [Gemmatimonadaceae bacterium]